MHYLLKGIALVSFAVVTAACFAERPQPGPINHSFPPSQLHGETYIFKFAQTQNGQLIAGGERVLYYEDNQWHAVNMRHTRGCRGLLVDGDTLWVGSLGEIGKIHLPLHSKSAYEVVSGSELSGSGEIWDLYKSKEFVVATTKEAAWLLHETTHQLTKITIPTKDRLMAVDWEGDVRISQPGGAIWRIVGNAADSVQNPLPDSKDTSWLWADSKFLLTTRALYQKTDDKFSVIMNAKALNTESIIATATGWDQRVAVPTIFSGLAVLDPALRTVSYYKKGSGLPSLMLYTAFADKNGRLWTGHKDGITVFESAKYGSKTVFKDAPLGVVRSNGLWISYEDRSEYYRADGSFEKLPRAFKLIETPQGPMFGLPSELLLNGKKIAVPGGRISKNIQLPDGRFLVVSGEKLFLVETASAQGEHINIGTPEVVGIALHNETLWVSTNDGTLCTLPVRPPFHLLRRKDIPGKVAADLNQVDGTIILFTRDRVMFGDDFADVENTVGISNPLMARTSDGTLWMAGEQQGVMRLGRLTRHGKILRWETTEAKGLNQLSDLRSFSAENQTLTLCSGTHLLELNAQLLTPSDRLSPPRMTFSYRGSRISNDTSNSSLLAALPADQNSLTFTATLPYDEFGEQPAYERRLLPTETAWVPTKASEKVSYPSLSSRSYTLEVRATHLGHTGATATYGFVVLPPWYLTWTAFSAYGALVGVLGFSAYRLRTRQIRARNAELERIVGERTRELAEASAAKTEFVASMSHEIRNPMNGVIGLVNILREQPALPKQAEHLRKLYHCAEQLRATVDDILDFSRIEARRVEVDESLFDLLDTLEAAAATVDPTGTSIKFQAKPPPGTSLRGDAGKLRQIFANYLTNALKYGVPPGARISIILSPSPDERLRVTVSVTSSGPTIDKEKLDKMFESFTRGNDAIERNIRGTGLGLAICKRYAEAMGGEVGAVSANSETTFYLNIPFVRASTTPDASALAVAAEPKPMLPARALAIEDEDYNRIVLGDILAKMNYTVDWATTGEEALRLARENGYDIILTDYRLPDTNGVELTKKILKFVPDPKPAVFAVTAYSTRERREECLAAGMVGFISKPITLEKLRSTVYNWGEGQLTKISLEASIRPVATSATPPSPEIALAWRELKRIAATDSQLAAKRAHTLNNLCRAQHCIDVAEQLEMLEGALERGEQTTELMAGIERLLRL